MNQTVPDDEFASLRKGLLEFAILQIIAGRDAYAADILERLADTPFATSEGTLYPLLSRLKRQSLLAYDWAESDAGPPRKYYRLTDAGQARLRSLHSYWQELTTTINTLGGGI